MKGKEAGMVMQPTLLTDLNGVRGAIVQGLADADGLDVAEVETAIAAAGGYGGVQLDSKQAEVIIAFVEELFGCELPAPADLRRDQFSTLEALVNLIAPAIGVPAAV